MSIKKCITGMLALFLVSQTAIAQEVAKNSEVLASRGAGVVTQEFFDSRLYQVPKDSRLPVIRDRNRLQELINNLLLQKQLTADARNEGFESDPEVIARMQYAAEAELARAWRERYAEIQGDADYEQMANEAYTMNQGQYFTEETIDVSHILVKTESRSEADSLLLATEIKAELDKDPSKFSALVKQYSEDSSAVTNKGSFKGIKKGDMVEPFEIAAFAMSAGEISDPVKTRFGYHVIRLDAHNEPQLIDFEKVKPGLIKRAERTHKERITNAYLSDLSAEEVKMTDQALTELVERHFGRSTQAAESE